MSILGRSLNVNCKNEKNPFSVQIKKANEKTELFPFFRKSYSHEIANQNLNEFQKILNDRRNMKTSCEDSFGDSFEDIDKPIIDININELREENENGNADFPEICIYYKADLLKNIKNIIRVPSKNLTSKIIFPSESPSSEMKKEYKKANSANTKKKHSGKSSTSKTYLKYSCEFMRIVQAMKLDNNK